MQRGTKVSSALATMALLGATLAFTAPNADTPEAVESAKGQWEIRASGARIIGGYGNNFAYNGDNVRPIEGTAHMTLNTEEGKGRLEITLRTSEESGPVHFAKDKKWEGEIRIVQMLNTSQMEKARIAEEAWLHGDTGNEAPVMPKVFNYFATWGPSKIFVNGQEVVPMIGSHTMFSEQARGQSGKIVNAQGEVYSPMAQDKTGFTDPGETEFHYVAHTTEPDQDNFPPHTGWVHLHFSDVEVVQKPAGVGIPYTSD